MTWEWFNTGADVQALITGRSTRHLQADIHAATQATLTDLRKGFTDSQERMDQRADERHRETLQAIQALKG